MSIDNIILLMRVAEWRREMESLLLLLEDIYGHSPDPVIYPGMTKNRYSSSIIETNRLRFLIRQGWLDGIITDAEHLSLLERYVQP